MNAPIVLTETQEAALNALVAKDAQKVDYYMISYNEAVEVSK